jgi:V8-like Glu-specific endopeptidase
MSKGKKGGMMVEPYQGSGRVVDYSLADSILEYDVSTSKGQSGAPILYDAGGKPIVIGIHNTWNSEKLMNSGVLFTRSTLRQIYDWIWEMETPLFRICAS